MFREDSAVEQQRGRLGKIETDIVHEVTNEEELQVLKYDPVWQGSRMGT